MGGNERRESHPGSRHEVYSCCGEVISGSDYKYTYLYPLILSNFNSTLLLLFVDETSQSYHIFLSHSASLTPDRTRFPSFGDPKNSAKVSSSCIISSLLTPK